MFPTNPKSRLRFSSSPVCRTVHVAINERDLQRGGVIIFARDRRKFTLGRVEMDVVLLPGNALQVVHLQRLDFDRDLDAIDIGIVNSERLALFRRKQQHVARGLLEQRDRIRVFAGVNDRRITDEWPLERRANPDRPACRCCFDRSAMRG